MKIPTKVREHAETIGGYLGLEHAWLDYEGQIVDTQPLNGWLAVGNYYGVALFRITKGNVSRVDLNEE